MVSINSFHLNGHSQTTQMFKPHKPQLEQERKRINLAAGPSKFPKQRGGQRNSQTILPKYSKNRAVFCHATYDVRMIFPAISSRVSFLEIRNRCANETKKFYHVLRNKPLQNFLKYFGSPSTRHFERRKGSGNEIGKDTLLITFHRRNGA